MAPGDIVDSGAEIASVWSNQLSYLPNSVNVNAASYSCCMPHTHQRQFAKRGVMSTVLIAGMITGTMFLGIFTGCAPIITGFDSPAPSKRLDAIVEASSLEDSESLVKLIEKLRSSVPTERMFAIRSLEIRIGETFGYEHAAPAWQRLEAFYHWLAYLEDQGIDTSTMDDRVDDDEGSENKPIVNDEG